MRENEGERRRLLRFHVIRLRDVRPACGERSSLACSRAGAEEAQWLFEHLRQVSLENSSFFALIYKKNIYTYMDGGDMTPGFTSSVFFTGFQQ